MAPEGTVKATRDAHPFTTYDLIANIVHEGEPGEGKGTYKAHVLHKVWVSLVMNRPTIWPHRAPLTQ